MPAPFDNTHALKRHPTVMHHLILLRDRYQYSFQQLALKFNYPSINAVKLSYYRFKRKLES